MNTKLLKALGVGIVAWFVSLLDVSLGIFTIAFLLALIIFSKDEKK